MENCIFCKIAKGDIPCSKLYEDGRSISFLDISPVVKGHALVIPRHHSETLQDMPGEDIAAVFNAAKKVAAAQKKALNSSGFNIFMNNFKVAGQVVPHAHVHIVPRYDGDGLLKQWPTLKYGDDEADSYSARIRKFLEE